MLVMVICIAATCNARQINRVNAKENGVNGADKKPDASAIQALLDKTRPNTELFFPAGIYLIDEPVLIKVNNLVIRGEAGTTFRFTNKADYYARYNMRVGMFNVAANNITFDQLYIDQNFTGSGRMDGASPLIAGIMMGGSYTGKSTNTSNITVTNCTIYDYYGDGVSVFHSSVNNFTVSKNTFISSYIVGNWTYAEDKGEQAINAASGSNITITDNVIRGALDDAIAVHNNCSNVVISGNDITTTGGRICINGTNNGLISGNTIRYIQDGGTGIWVSFEFEAPKFTLNNKLTITGNTVIIPKGIKVVSGMRLFGPGSNITITGNSFETEDKQGIGIEIKDRLHKPGNKKYFGDSIFIRDNRITNFKTGISRTISKQVKPPLIEIGDNTITNADTLIFSNQP